MCSKLPDFSQGIEIKIACYAISDIPGYYLNSPISFYTSFFKRFKEAFIIGPTHKLKNKPSTGGNVY
jgi:hypothetical protein